MYKISFYFSFSFLFPFFFSFSFLPSLSRCSLSLFPPQIRALSLSSNFIFFFSKFLKLQSSISFSSDVRLTRAWYHWKALDERNNLSGGLSPETAGIRRKIRRKVRFSWVSPEFLFPSCFWRKEHRHRVREGPNYRTGVGQPSCRRISPENAPPPPPFTLAAVARRRRPPFLKLVEGFCRGQRGQQKPSRISPIRRSVSV